MYVVQFEHDGLIFEKISDNEVQIVGASVENLQSLYCPTLVKGYIVTKIAKNAFLNSTCLELVCLSCTIEAIEQRAFANCINLKHVFRFNNGYPMFISTGAFYGCENLIEVHADIESVGVHAFANCYALKEISLSPSCKKISSLAFQNCQSLISVYFWGDFREKSILHISDNAFLDCSLKYVYSGREITFEISSHSGLAREAFDKNVKIMVTNLSNLNELIFDGYFVTEWKK